MISWLPWSWQWNNEIPALMQARVTSRKHDLPSTFLICFMPLTLDNSI